MRKFRLILLFVLIVGVSTFLSVTGFFINENKSAVVNWLDNKIVVTNEDYKQLVEESSLTVSELNAQIKSHENKNESLENEKLVLQDEIYELELNQESNQELIDNYLAQIDDINAELEDNNQQLKDLRDLINAIYNDLILSIIELPEELQTSSLSFNSLGYDFFVTGSSNTYYFHYETGTLTYVCESTPSLIKEVPNGYIFGRQGRNSVCYFDTTDFLCVEIVKNCYSYNFNEYENGCYIVTKEAYHYFDYTTKSITFTQSVATYVNDFGSCYVIDFENYFIAYRVFSTNANIYYVNKTTNDFVMFLNGVANKNYLYHLNVFEFKNNIYMVRSGTAYAGIYKLNFDDELLELVCELPLASCWISDIHVFDEFVLFNYQKTYYSFDGNSVSMVGENIYADLTPSIERKQYLLYEDETKRIFSSSYTGGIFTFDKTTNIVSVLQTYNYPLSFYYTNGNLILFKCSDTFELNAETGDIIKISSANSSGYVEIDDCLYIYGTTHLYMYVKSTSEYSLVGSINSVGFGYVDYGDKILFYDSDDFLIRDKLLSTSTRYSYDSKKSDIKNGIIYVPIDTDLSQGELYYKYVYNSDFTSYTRTLVIFNK